MPTGDDKAVDVRDHELALVQGAQTETANLRDTPDTAFNVSTGLTYEFLMFNTSKASLDALPVRQARAHATDRDAIVRRFPAH